jgi:hypothetical protein
MFCGDENTLPFDERALQKRMQKKALWFLHQSASSKCAGHSAKVLLFAVRAATAV